MKSIARCAGIALVCLVLAGCDETFPPIQSGNVTYWQGGKPQGSAQPLSASQAENLSAWLQRHRQGWQPVVATYAPAITIYAVHPDGTKTSVNLMQETLVVGQHQRSISAIERQELLSIIGAQNGG